jgi:hypothetical protein
MADRAFKFVSPGIFLNEIDNSQIPQLPEAVGPTIIGRSTKGPGLSPRTVQSFSDFIDLYGEAVPGGPGGDYRSSKLAGPTYGVYAAQAYLNAGVGPVNYVRLLGLSNPDATGFGLAGWTTTYYGEGSRTAKDFTTGGGALGLFLVDSGSGSPQSGTLAAVFYMATGSLYLSGALSLGGVSSQYTGTGSNTMIATTVDTSIANTQFKILIGNDGGTSQKTFTFNFDRESNRFIRKVFNTNPVLTNRGVIDPNTLTKNEQVYWLGETYETAVSSLTASNGVVNAFLAPLAVGNVSTTTNAAYHRMRFTDTFAANTNTIDASTGWFFSQDLSNDTASYSIDNMTKLFRFHGLEAGSWTQKNIKVSIENIRPSPNPDADPYGTFSVIVRDVRDSDTNPIVLERFDKVNLNPSSVDFIGIRIGDKYRKFDYSQRVNKEYGQYDNVSLYMRIELNPAIENGLTNPVSLPFGVYGPIRPKTLTITANTAAGTSYIASGSWPGVNLTTKLLNTGSSGQFMTNFTASITFPGTRTRVSSSDSGITNPTDAYFGFASSISSTTSRFDTSCVDTLRLFGDNTSQLIGLAGLDANSPFEHHWKFTLDDLIAVGTTAVYHSPGSRAAGTSYTAVNGASGAEQGYTSILAAGYNRFTAAFQGGFDGLNIQEAEPFQYNRITGGSRTNSYEVNTLEVALDLIANPEMIETNIITVPGVRNSSITDKVITIAEARADALAVIDPDDGYDAVTESTSDFKARLGSVTTAVNNLVARRINSSYACTYYPWVQIRDTISGQLVWVPPSVVALGTMASSEKRSEIWFAPAGFNRGGLSSGAAGIPVVGVAEKLTSKQRDTLYLNNINPIASFPSEGIVVFGQKTLQVTPSALDRINVRRMMIYVKKQISRFATRVLFDQNVKVTWNRFKADVEPFLASVQSRLGITEFKVVLDETTTTQDLVDRNILYAKIFLKPARSIEFIAVDFVITRGGASFED